MIRHIKAILTIFLVVGCGALNTGENDANSDGLAQSARDKEAQADATVVAGAVQYAFDLTVDGLSYSNVEDYYTAQVRTLKEKVLAAGYNADKAEFRGRLGFADFIQDMVVFVVSSDGKQGRGVVDSQGNFSVAIDSKDETSRTRTTSYAVRANKRVQIILSNGGVPTKKLCYNFSAITKSSENNTILLDSFETDFTLYDCEQQSDGLEIPDQSTRAAPVRDLLLSSPSVSIWANAGNEFYIDTKIERRRYVLPSTGSTPYALSEPEALQAQSEPIGFSKLSDRFLDGCTMTCRYTIPVAGDTLLLRSSGDWTDVNVVRNGVSIKAFLIREFGLGGFDVFEDRVFAIGRYKGENIWKVGELDYINNRFMPRADSPNAITYNFATGVIGGDFAVAADNRVLFFHL
jgi:hypothetical protein